MCVCKPPRISVVPAVQDAEEQRSACLSGMGALLPGLLYPFGCPLSRPRQADAIACTLGITAS